MRSFVPHLATLVIFVSAGWLVPSPLVAAPAQVQKGFDCEVMSGFLGGCSIPVATGAGIWVTNKAGNQLLQCQLSLTGEPPEKAEILEFTNGGPSTCVSKPAGAPTNCRLVKRPSGNATLICKDNPSTDPA